jgi:molybdopterin-dependent oxidoreductase alpha subunit
MLSTLRETSLRGVPLVVLNPLRERGLEAFRSPQHVKEMLTGDSTKLATHYLQPKVGSDPYVLQGLMKRLFELERAGDHSALDRQFISQHTEGLDLLEAQLADLEWTTITSRSGLSFDEIDLVAQLYARSSATIVAYGMGVTQHAHGTQNVQQIANLLLLRGNIGKPGAGICPLRGHSNVQGDRTMGIDERPSPALLDRIAAECGFAPPRAPGCSVIECIELIQRDQVRVLISMGGNFAVAAPDPVATHAAMGKLALTVGIHTKLNRSHLLHSGDALILPALARSDIDQQPSGLQSVTVEDSMSMVHASRGFKPPPSREVRSEPAIVAGMAAAVLTKSKIAWLELAADYDRVRDLVARVIPGFEGFNERVKTPGGLQLHNAAANRQWNTPSGRARFLPMTRYPEQAHSSLPLILSTIRSHDQYNTTIYGMNDRYRGVHGRRDVVFMNAEDMYTRGLRTGDAIRISTHARTLKGFVAMEYAIARGSCAAYFPEANGLVALDAFDAQSHTPAFKSVAVEVLRD